jgi:hypothetical protein
LFWEFTHFSSLLVRYVSPQFQKMELNKFIKKWFEKEYNKKFRDTITKMENHFFNPWSKLSPTPLILDPSWRSNLIRFNNFHLFWESQNDLQPNRWLNSPFHGRYLQMILRTYSMQGARLERWELDWCRIWWRVFVCLWFLKIRVQSQFNSQNLYFWGF